MWLLHVKLFKSLLSDIKMTKDEMLKMIARYGYNVGFGAKKNFATFDIVSKMPGWVSLFSLTIGILALFIPALTSNVISAALIIIGVATMYIQFYDGMKDAYNNVGIKHTKIFNQLEIIYRNVKSESNFDSVEIQKQVDELMTDFYEHTESRQIFGSNWYAHYKFFHEMEKDWVEQELGLSIKDKIPLSLIFWIGIVVIGAISCFLNIYLAEIVAFFLKLKCSN